MGQGFLILGGCAFKIPRQNCGDQQHWNRDDIDAHGAIDDELRRRFFSATIETTKPLITKKMMT
jgi:hypothetical protein